MTGTIQNFSRGAQGPSLVATALIAIAIIALSVVEGGFSIELIAAISVAVWWLVLLIVGFNLSPAPTSGAAILAGALLAGLATLSALSMSWASDAGLAYDAVVRVTAYLGLFALVVVATPLAGVRCWLNGIMIGFGVVVAIALGSRLQSWLPGPRGELTEFIPDISDRLSYPIDYWNGLAGLAALAALLLLWAGAEAKGRIARSLATAWLPACGLAIYLSASRGGVAAFAVGAVLLLVLSANSSRLGVGLSLGLGLAGAGALVAVVSGMDELVDGSTQGVGASQGDDLTVLLLGTVAVVALVRYLADPLIHGVGLAPRLVRAAAVLCAAVVVVGVVAADPVQRLDEFSAVEETQATEDISTRNLASASGSGRSQFWQTGLDAFSEQPLRGIGAGGFGTYWNQNGSVALVVDNAHSLFVESLAELGIIGLLLVLGFFAVGVLSALRARARQLALAPVLVAVIGTGLTTAAIEWTWEIPAVIAPVIVAVALASGPVIAGRARGEAVHDEARAATRRFGWGVVTLAVAWIAISIGGIEFLSQVKLEDSRQAVADGRLEEAVGDAQDASTTQPWASEPYVQLALVRELQGDLDAARSELEEAIERAPEEWSLWLIKSRLILGQGEVEEAREALRRAVRLNPRAPILSPAAAELAG